MSLNIWDKRDFLMCGLGRKCKTLAKMKYICRCVKYSYQRVVRGYADCDVWNMYGYIQELMPAMLKHLRDTRVGSPVMLDLPEGTDCHKEWTKKLNRMIFLWRESNEETCVKRNPYEDEYMQAFDVFCEKYGILGEELQTPDEKQKYDIKGVGTMHFMSEIPEYAELSENYRKAEAELDAYRMKCKDKAMDMLKEDFFSLWD